MDGRFPDEHFNQLHHQAYSQHNQHIMPSSGFESNLHRLQTISAEDLNHFSDFEESSRGLTPNQGPPKTKRRQVHGPDHIKHRRTRSGCYTCRQRRVKCDEVHPVCERCRKGKRECVYPEPNSSKTPRDSKGKSLLADSGSNSSEEDDDLNDDRLPGIPDDEEKEDMPEPLSAVSAPGVLDRMTHDSMSPPDKPRSPTSAVEPSAASHRVPRRLGPSRMSSKPQLKAGHLSGSKYMSLPKDIRFYLKYHREEISSLYYFVKYDGGDFFKTTFLEIALGYEPLLYAVTAFSAYFHALSHPNGRVQTFLHYYDKSVTSLRQSLAKSPRYSIATLLTILQLASFEEMLGDWVNLLSHQKAAFEVLTQLFTPQSVMQSETHRKTIVWYMRFDLMAGLMSGNETTLGREWHVAVTDFYERQARDRPNELGPSFEEKFAKSRLLALEMSLVFGKKAKGILSDEEFLAGLGDLRRQMGEHEHIINTAFADRRTYVKDFPNAPADRSGDIVDATDPNFLLAGELWTWNSVNLDFWGLNLMFKAQLAQIDRSIDPQEIVDDAFRICKMFEAMEYASENNKATIMGNNAALGIAATAMPRDQKHIMWCRRKYALIESCGYTYPAVLRKRMSDAWNEDVTKWWLPDDDQTQPQPLIIAQIREFIGYRATIPSDTLTEELRDMKGLFNAMSLGEDPEQQRERRSTGTNESHEQLVEDVDWSQFEAAHDFGHVGEGTGGSYSSPDMSWHDLGGVPSMGAGPSTESFGVVEPNQGQLADGFEFVHQ